METIIKYKANDGVEFLVELECVSHESNCLEAKHIMDKMSERPDSCDFSNGSGYLQHDQSTLLAIRNELLEFCKRYTTHEWIQETIDKGYDADPSWAGRIIDECTPRTISKMWYRFHCIDSQGREWGQPYYANHPHEAEQKRLN